ncbi:hypothetical protein WJX72_011773 [[Myrmecia] bisecta]|uniref:Pyruvate phosphate dikinase AMP/ATP-binding domain-containing protein n=1 Tax=[Myrmecia] bisecta TaxID=41462 RepID=A0AAW1PEZ5_9CHLO
MRSRAVATTEELVATSHEAEVIATTKYDCGITVVVSKDATRYKVAVTANPWRPMVLHWAINDWKPAPEASRPPGTVTIDDKAVQTPIPEGQPLVISFPEDSCPNRVVFVLKETQPEAWINNGGCDFAAQLKPPGVRDVIDKVIAAEATYSNWGLHNRFVLANEILDAAEAAGPPGMAFILVWMRLSTLKQLDWYRNSSYQSKDIAHVQKVIAQRMADKARSAKDPGSRMFARMCLAGLPRGGGDGDAIRMGILQIMRENGIREGHRPGIEDDFLEQWHQKLHTNTTPEDITICEAYLAFLHSGSMDDFWRVLWDNGRISREALQTMDRAITGHPKHLPHLIGPFQHYLWILKITHSGADMDTALEMARGQLDGDLVWTLHDILAHRNEWWVPGKIVEARGRLEGYWRAEGASRDVLLLDIALDNYFRTCIERTDRGGLKGDDIIELIALVLKNALYASESLELAQAWSQWEKVKSEERWTPEWGLKALAATQRIELSLSAFADSIYSLVQPHAELFGESCKIDPSYILNFGEEVVRGQPIFVLSGLLQALEPMLRNTAGVGSWQVVSQQAVVGKVSVLPSLADIQGRHFSQPLVVIAQQVGGMEDIPENVVAVLTSSTTDVLSHVAIRARSQGVLLASCFDAAELDRLRQLEGHTVSVSVDAMGGVVAQRAREEEASTSNGASKNGAPALRIPAPTKSAAWALPEAQFAEGVVGGKSRNLASIRSKLPDSIAVPASAALPFGTFERVLADGANTPVAADVAGLQKELAAAKKGSIPPALAELRQTVATQLKPPKGFAAEVAGAAGSAGIAAAGSWKEGTAEWKRAWGAICQVWASKWNDRAWLSRAANGVADDDLYMACLLQEVVPAEYAFVVHTANPMSGRKGELFGEVVVGMGEALVGNYPGRALSFVAEGGGTPRILALPSKRLGLFAHPATLIVRSDSNGEDLEGFAGAGLYDSVPLDPLQERSLDYAEERLMWDAEFQRVLLASIAAVGREVEAAFGGVPQDIEGVWANGSISVVQSRPQIL